MDGAKTASIKLSKTVNVTIGRPCIICGETIEMRHLDDKRMICPACIKKLRKLINEVPDE